MPEFHCESRERLFVLSRRCRIKIKLYVAILIAVAFTCGASVYAQNVTVGPYVHFTTPDSAVVYWDTDVPCNSIIEFGTSEATLDSRVENSASTTIHEVSITNLLLKTKYYYHTGHNDGSDHFTATYWFDNAINFSVIDCSDAVSPYGVDDLTPIYEAAADHIANSTGIAVGYCLVYGSREGRLAFEIAKRSRLTVIGIDDDTNMVQTAKTKLMEAGVYGARVIIRHTPEMTNTSLPRIFFNLVVSDSMISEGVCPGSASEMFRVLRPAGGTAFLGQPSGCSNQLTQAELTNWLDAASLNYTTTNDANGVWSKVVRDPLADTAWWTHQYGSEYHNGSINDNLEGATGVSDMELQWLGRPGSDSGLDRGPRLPAPICHSGTLYHQGENRIMALDSYNGAMLWSLEIPQLRRLNMPRDCSNMACDSNTLYLAVKDECWSLDARTGIRKHTQKLNDVGHEWGLVFRSGSNLYGSAVIENSVFTGFWSHYGWYGTTETDESYKICSKYIFANNAENGSRIWSYTNGVIVNPTICMGNGRIYFIESRDSTITNYPSGRIGLPELWLDQYMVALDAQTGTNIWEQPIDIAADSTYVFYMMYAPSNNALIVEFFSDLDDSHHFYAFDASDGKANWSTSYGAGGVRDHQPQMQRPVVIGENVYLWPEARSVADGKSVLASGVPRGNCGATSASRNIIFHNPHDSMTCWNINTSTSSEWDGIRPGCWISMIPSGGMFLAPERGGGCRCGGWLNTSVGFVKKQ